MFHWLKFNSRLLVVGVLIGMLFSIPIATADSPTDDMWGQVAQKIQSQNPNLAFDRQLMITQAARAPYQRLFPDRLQYQRLQIHPSVGGVLFGREPDPIGRAEKFEPIGLPNFEYELLPNKESPKLVRLTFKTADGTEFAKVEVSAGVVTAATAMALDGRLTMYTSTGSGTAVHPGLEGHRLGCRPAIIDGIPFTTLRQSEKTKDAMAKGRRAGISHNAILWERPWTLSKTGFKLPKMDDDPDNSILQFVIRDADNLGATLDVSSQLNRDMFGSLTQTERQLFTELQETILVARIVYGARKGWIINFDKGNNWVKMIDDLAPVYKENLDPRIDNSLLETLMNFWSLTFKDKDVDQGMTLGFRGKDETLDFKLK